MTVYFLFQIYSLQKDLSGQSDITVDGIYSYATQQDAVSLQKHFRDDDNIAEAQGDIIYERQRAFIPGNREPCEASDVSSMSSSSKSEIYRLIGPHKQIGYDVLKHITDNFHVGDLAQGGRVVGTGGFGDVFLGLFDNGLKVAVKRLKDVDEVDKQFQNELENLTKYRHQNIVCLYAYCVEGPARCLVYEYMVNGSLEDRLHCRGGTPPLTVSTRLQILTGTAQGIAFLNGQGIVHRDIKSANVLLDEDFQAKVGDFATARGGPQGNATVPLSASVVIGTSAYLAPEAMNFDVSTKLDAFSFGIVILEVLTALAAMDTDREDRDLKSHVEENGIEDMLDNSGGKWPDGVVDKLYRIFEKCTYKKKQRANVTDIIVELLEACSC